MNATHAPAVLTVGLGQLVDETVQTLVDALVAARHHLHRYPEVGWQEHGTMEFLSRTLDRYEVPHRTGIAGTGIVVDIEGAHPGPTRAYRADMDGIGLSDGKTVEYASRNEGVMHACGHDFHMVVALGVAVTLHRLRDRIRGRVRVLFQPAEELVPSGSAAMIEAGAMDGVEGIYAIHAEPALPAGRIGYRYGAMTASADMFEVLIRGKSGHSSRPYLATDAILIATKAVEAIYQLVAQRADPLESAVINVGTIQGGDAANVICGYVKLTGAIRCFDHVIRDNMRLWLDEMVGGIVRGMGGEYELAVHRGAPPLHNDPGMVDRIRRAAEEVLGPEGLHEIPRPSMGGEDFSFYGERAPVAMFRVGTATGPHAAQLHNELFDAGDAPIGSTVRIVSRILLAHDSDTNAGAGD